MTALALEEMERKAAEVADFLTAVANKNRLMVLCHLAESGELTVTELTARVRLSQPAVSQHLARMMEEGLITVRAEGRQRFYALMPGPVSDLLTLLQTHFCPPDGARAAAQ